VLNSTPCSAFQAGRRAEGTFGSGYFAHTPETLCCESFAVLEETPGVPGLDIPGLDIVSIAKGYGCDAARLDNLEEIKKAAVAAWTKSKPTVLEIPISRQIPPLI
jgi:TPP-dependent trihydroxycyclohexane-1,2-dione (THcHDO) dehydratase